MQKIGIVGLGTIGGELGPYLAKHGAAVYGVDTDGNVRRRAELSHSFAGVFSSIDQLPMDLDTVIEATPEIPQLKAEVLSQIAKGVTQNAYILMTSSTMPSSSFARLVDNSKRLMNAHVLPDLITRRFVEFQGSNYIEQTTTLENVSKKFSDLDFHTVIVNGESEGFIFNQIWHGVMLTAFDLMKRYKYEPWQIDHSCAEYFGWPYGPVMAMDLIGHDTLYNVFSLVAKKRGGSIPEAIKQLFEERMFGLKSGKGFYEYNSPDLSGLHSAAKKFVCDYHSAPINKYVIDSVWGTIKMIANELLKSGQREEDIRAAVRYGFPIEKYDPFE